MFSTRPSATGKRGAHRAEDDRKPVTGKVAAVVALGALASVGAAGGGSAITPLAASTDLAAAIAVSGAPEAPVIETRHEIQPGLETAKLMRSEGLMARQHVTQAIQHASAGYTARQAELKRQQEAAAAEAARVAAQKAAEEAARRPKVAKPAEGAFTSGFGARWGTTHYGVDIANSIGTPILSAMDGVVIEAGPASGFGLWVRVQHGDGTVTIYGHVNEILVSEGQQVAAGQQIATMGNRGQSTGPHLHFEVWLNGSQKIDPVGWLGERGINL
ncbi:M23 family metallopeptidase [Saccharothrix variisporea]|uniref:Murein DD-endopeptidase MepM/ murein hydrolase activator NlpD n=1 Tax=Saccharothrix variisporea TaxID=543527 RepID=A0A495XJ02_9PSEU|nr:M23 family metallopeptidase [Saccharothrix variisporea]RKT73962.1 murein DD-endopeptidase MepM/ murein hydrolase activator NlpD [Saccharothrix variisporea]